MVLFWMWWWCIYLDKLQSSPVSPLIIGCLFSALIFPARWVCSFLWGHIRSPDQKKKKIPRCQWCILHKYSRGNVLRGSRPLVWVCEELHLMPHTWTLYPQVQRMVDWSLTPIRWEEQVASWYEGIVKLHCSSLFLWMLHFTLFGSVCYLN